MTMDVDIWSLFATRDNSCNLECFIVAVDGICCRRMLFGGTVEVQSTRSSHPYTSLIAMQNLVTFSHTVCMHVGVPKNFGNAVAPPLGMGCVADPEKHVH